MTKDTIIIAMDSFKGSATSKELGVWLAEGIKRVVPDQQINVLPIADGGEGTLASLVEARQGRLITTEVLGPLGNTTAASYGMLDKETAVIEMAEASGITLTQQNEEDALTATTYGVGQLLLHAIDQGAKKLYIGIGGSATTDGGAGMAQALGAKLLDHDGQDIKPGAVGLKDLTTIQVDAIDPRLKEVDIQILSDVNNPLIGENGASAVYGPQKGIPADRIKEVDHWLENYANVLNKDLGIAIAEVPGAGAAGGLGGGLLAFTEAHMAQGIDQILEILRFDELLDSAQLVITGEGRIDNQSINGKAPIGIAKKAKAHRVPVVVVVGARDADLSKVYEAGVDLVLSTIPRPMSLEEAMKDVKENTILTGETVMRAFRLNQ